MPTLEHSYTETNRNGGRKIVSGKTVAALENPHVGNEWQDFLDNAADDVDPFYIVAYIIAEYGDDINDDLADTTKDDLRDYVVAIEAKQSQPTEEARKRELSNLLNEANAAEQEKIVAAAEEALENTDIDDTHAHEDAIQRGNSE